MTTIHPGLPNGCIKVYQNMNLVVHLAAMLVVATICCAYNSRDSPNTILESTDQDKRSPKYDFGLGKRAYSYVSEYKRLPVYNFGLGKRAREYSFGLGKRADDFYESQYDDYDFSRGDSEALSDDKDVIEKQELWDSDIKRGRPYGFGLGKRFDSEDPDEWKENDKRLTQKYNFGLGKRNMKYNFGLGKRTMPKEQSYSPGLGKRQIGERFNFGLGKRRQLSNRFQFGLGRR